MLRLTLIALVAACSLSACSVEVGGQGEVVIADAQVQSGEPEPANAGPAQVGGKPSGAAGGAPVADDAGGAMPVDDAALGPSAVADAGAGNPSTAREDAAATSSQDAASSVVDAAVPTKPGNPAQPDPVDPKDAAVVDPVPAFVLSSPAFAPGDVIPAKHTCKGADVSPAFSWSGAPVDAEVFALVLTTRTTILGSTVPFTRWAIWNISATRTGLPAMIEEGHAPSDVPGAFQASNESDTSYGGNFTGAGGSFSGAGGPGGGTGPGGGAAGGGVGPGGGGGGEEEKTGRRYRGPCSYGFPQTFEFTLYALAKMPEAPAWRLGITPDEIASWLASKAKVLGQTSLKGVTP